MQKRKPWLYWLLAVLPVLLLAGIGTVGYLAYKFFDLGRHAANLEEVAAAYRAGGMPWEAKDLRPDPPIKPEDNAAPLLLDIFAKKAMPSLEPDSLPIGQLLADRKLGEVEAKLKPYEEMLDAAVVASKRRGLDFNRDWDMGPELMMPEYGRTKALGRGLCFRAQLRAAKGNVNGAVSDLRAARNLAVLIGTEPNSIAMLVNIANRRIAYDAVRRCAFAFADNEKALTSLRKMLAEHDPDPDFTRALRGEAYMGVTICRNLPLFGSLLENREGDESETESPAEIDPGRLRRTGLPEGTAARGFMTRHLQAWVETSAAIKRHPNDPEAVGAEMERIADRMDDEVSQSAIMNAILYPVFKEAAFALKNGSADRVATDALLSALIVRAQTGRMPANIAQVPGAQLDPFSGKQLRLKMSGKSIRIYSVGRNRQDDDGIDQREIQSGPRDRTKFDIVAAYPPIKPLRRKA